MVIKSERQGSWSTFSLWYIELFVSALWTDTWSFTPLSRAYELHLPCKIYFAKWWLSTILMADQLNSLGIQLHAYKYWMCGPIASDYNSDRLDKYLNRLLLFGLALAWTTLEFCRKRLNLDCRNPASRPNDFVETGWIHNRLNIGWLFWLVRNLLTIHKYSLSLLQDRLVVMAAVEVLKAAHSAADEICSYAPEPCHFSKYRLFVFLVKSTILFRSNLFFVEMLQFFGGNWITGRNHNKKNWEESKN